MSQLRFHDIFPTGKIFMIKINQGKLSGLNLLFSIFLCKQGGNARVKLTWLASDEKKAKAKFQVKKLTKTGKYLQELTKFGENLQKMGSIGKH